MFPWRPARRTIGATGTRPPCKDPAWPRHEGSGIVNRNRAVNFIRATS